MIRVRRSGAGRCCCCANDMWLDCIQFPASSDTQTLAWLCLFVHLSGKKSPLKTYRKQRLLASCCSWSGQFLLPWQTQLEMTKKNISRTIFFHIKFWKKVCRWSLHANLISIPVSLFPLPLYLPLTVWPGTPTRRQRLPFCEEAAACRVRHSSENASGLDLAKTDVLHFGNERKSSGSCFCEMRLRSPAGSLRVRRLALILLPFWCMRRVRRHALVVVWDWLRIHSPVKLKRPASVFSSTPPSSTTSRFFHTSGAPSGETVILFASPLEAQKKKRGKNACRVRPCTYFFPFDVSTFWLAAQMETTAMNMHEVPELWGCRCSSPSLSRRSIPPRTPPRRSLPLAPHTGSLTLWYKSTSWVKTREEYSMGGWKFVWHCTKVWGRMKDSRVRVCVCEPSACILQV